MQSGFHNRRKYHLEDVKKVLIFAKSLLRIENIWHVLDYGSAGGHILGQAVKLFGKHGITYYGIEGGSLVGACSPKQMVRESQALASKLDVIFQGTDAECVFEDMSHHPVFESTGPILSHMYDGGIMLGSVMEHVFDNVSKISPAGSVMCFVSADASSFAIHEEQVGVKEIKSSMKKRGWRCSRTTYCVREFDCSPTMCAIFFTKLVS